MAGILPIVFIETSRKLKYDRGYWLEYRKVLTTVKGNFVSGLYQPANNLGKPEAPVAAYFGFCDEDFFHSSARYIQVSTTVSGLSEIDSMS